MKQTRRYGNFTKFFTEENTFQVKHSHMIFGQVSVKSHCQSDPWIKLNNHLCCISNGLKFGSTCSTPNAKRSVYRFGSHCSQWLALLLKYPGQWNYHQKIVMVLTDQAKELFLSQLTAITQSRLRYASHHSLKRLSLHMSQVTQSELILVSVA